MGEVQQHQPVLLVMAVFTRHSEIFDWVRSETAERWGPAAESSSRFAFAETDYYQATMGAALELELLTFERLLAPDTLADVKVWSNSLEQKCAAEGSWPEERPLNIDPGYLTLAKFVLATTKDASHRIYLGQGIYAEVTLSYSYGAWRAHEWTYPNYRRRDYQEFLTDCRSLYRRLLQESSSP